MTRFTLVLYMDNAAFDQDARGPEIARILREAAAEAESGQLANPGDGMRLCDVNGNSAGSASVTQYGRRPIR